MGKIFIVIGKSATGKDSIYKGILKKETDLKTVVGYTTRPIRNGEQEGVEYHFVSTEQLEELRKSGKVIEERCYHTVLGDWYYFTADDGQLNLAKGNYLFITTLEGYEQIKKYYGSSVVVPIYIDVENGERLERAIRREKQEMSPNYAEVCRRFLADEEDFAEDKIKHAGIAKKYENNNLEDCMSEILRDINVAVRGKI